MFLCAEIDDSFITYDLRYNFTILVFTDSIKMSLIIGNTGNWDENKELNERI